MIGIYIGLTSNKFDARHPGTWLSRIIQLVTRSRWNHAVILLNLWGLNVVIHAQAWIRLELYKTWLAKTDRELMLFEVLAKPDTEWLFDQLNKLYDVKGLAWQLVYIISGKWYGKTNVRAEKTYFCSELAVRFLGVKESWLYAPADIPALEQLGYIKLMGYYQTKKGLNKLIELPFNAPAPEALKAAA